MIIFHLIDNAETVIKINSNKWKISYGSHKYKIVDKSTDKIKYEIPLSSVLYVEYQ